MPTRPLEGVGRSLQFFGVLESSIGRDTELVEGYDCFVDSAEDGSVFRVEFGFEGCC